MVKGTDDGWTKIIIDISLSFFFPFLPRLILCSRNLFVHTFSSNSNYYLQVLLRSKSKKKDKDKKDGHKSGHKKDKAEKAKHTDEAVSDPKTAPKKAS